MSINKIKKILEIDSDVKLAVFELYEQVEKAVKISKGDTPKVGIDFKQPKDGVNGKDGKAGKTGERGKMGLTGADGKTPVAGIDFPLPEDGKDADEEKILKELEKKIPEPIKGEPPEHEWKGTALRFKNPDGKWGKWKNLVGEKGEKGRSGESRVVGYGSAHDQRMKRADLSSQCDGSNMVFTLPEQFKPDSVVLQSTQFPIIYRPDIDYVVTSADTITLQSAEVGAPQLGQTLIALYVKL